MDLQVPHQTVPVPRNVILGRASRAAGPAFDLDQGTTKVLPYVDPKLPNPLRSFG